MLTRTRKRSARITLVLVGAAALAACGDGGHDQRDLYASKQDCVKDWGDETKCEAAPATAASNTGRSHTGGGYFWGPLYSGSGYRTGSVGNTGTSASSIGAARSGSSAIGSSSVSRGGFGSSASSHSSGG